MVEERNFYDRDPVLRVLAERVRKAVRLRRSGVKLAKLANVACCLASRLLRLERVLGLPYFVMLEPTNACNLRCPLCPTGELKLARPTGFMADETFERILAPLSGSLLELHLLCYGEPTLHPRLPEMIARAKEHGIFVSLGSNGHFFGSDEVAARWVDCGLDHVYVAMDGATQESFEKYRVRGRLDELLNGVRRLVRVRAARRRITPRIELQFIVMRHNEHEMEAARALARAVGADAITFKSVSFHVAEFDDPEVRSRFRAFEPRDPRYRLYGGRDGDLRWSVPIENRCDFLWRALVVHWDGTVVPCGMDPHEQLAVGRIEDGLEAVWNGAGFRRLRRTILADKKSLAPCANCPGAR